MQLDILLSSFNLFIDFLLLYVAIKVLKYFKKKCISNSSHRPRFHQHPIIKVARQSLHQKWWLITLITLHGYKTEMPTYSDIWKVHFLFLRWVDNKKIITSNYTECYFSAKKWKIVKLPYFVNLLYFSRHLYFIFFVYLTGVMVESEDKVFDCSYRYKVL